MTNKFDIDFTEEERERYNHIKDLSLKHYPQISNDNVMENLSEYLYIYYAKHGCLPDPVEESSNVSKMNMCMEPKIIEYKTPSDAGETLVRSNNEEAD